MSEKKSHGCLLGGLGCLSAIGLLAVLIVVVGVCVSDGARRLDEFPVHPTGRSQRLRPFRRRRWTT